MPGLERIGAEFADTLNKIPDYIRKSGCLCRGNPLQSVSIRIYALFLQNNPYALSSGLSFVITIQVMTLSQVSPHYNDPVRSFAKCVHHYTGRHHA